MFADDLRVYAQNKIKKDTEQRRAGKVITGSATTEFLLASRAEGKRLDRKPGRKRLHYFD